MRSGGSVFNVGNDGAVRPPTSTGSAAWHFAQLASKSWAPLGGPNENPRPRPCAWMGRLKPATTPGRLKPATTPGRLKPATTPGRLKPATTSGRPKPAPTYAQSTRGAINRQG